MIIRQELPSDWLKRSEQEALFHLKEAVNHWIEFCKIVLTIQESKLWKQVSKTWHEYVRLTWNLDSSRIRQYKSALPYAEAITMAIPDISVQESDIRLLKQVIEPDDPRLLDVYQLGRDVSQKLGKPIQKSFYNHILEVLESEETTSGFVEVADGALMPGDFEDMRMMAILHQMDEARQRNHARMKIGKRSIRLTAKKTVNNQYVILSDEPIPDSFQFYIWVEDK